MIRCAQLRRSSCCVRSPAGSLALVKPAQVVRPEPGQDLCRLRVGLEKVEAGLDAEAGIDLSARSIV
jgi:hypothetical protein